MIAILLAAVANCHAAQMSDSTQVQYPPDGIYNSFGAFRNGNPDLKRERMIRSLNDSLFTIRQWVNSENLYFLDEKGEKASYDPFTFWGFAERGVLYLYLGGKFHKVHTLGSISYFLESYPVIKGNMAPVVTESRATSSYRFLDMETGDLLDYTPENLQQLLERDEALYREYKSIVSLKEKKKRMYRYMEEFNKKYPLRKLQN
jgi:hypothetical protein